VNANRRQFGLGLAASLATLTAAASSTTDVQASQDKPASDSATAGKPHYFFKNPTFEVIFLTSLGRAYGSAGNVGKVLYLTRQVEDGNFESAFNAFKSAGDEARTQAEESLAGGHKESARQAYLWAQNYYDSATYFADGSADPSRLEPTWELLYDCWLKSLPLFDPPIEPVSIPYENTQLRGFFFRAPTPRKEKHPLLILVNGSDGSLLDMWLLGGAGALARGYDCLTFDGPGQGYALWKQKIFFRPDWEKVITPVVDYVLNRPEIDPKRIALQGISQGGYWVPRAVAFEHRIAATIADPGVVDVFTSWAANIPQALQELLHAGKKAEFDSFLSKSLNPASKATLNFRVRPYGFTSYYDTFKAAQSYNLESVAQQIRCPILITNPANEAYWPGQSQRLYDLVTSPKKLVSFSESDGADLHCEPQGTGIRDQRIFNWLDETLKA
jgi:pimeloyl-ACP methyl ester carboxylesterase